MVAARRDLLQIARSEPAGRSPAPELLALGCTNDFDELVRTARCSLAHRRVRAVQTAGAKRDEPGAPAPREDETEVAIKSFKVAPRACAGANRLVRH